MNLLSPEVIKKILAAHSAAPLRRFGQNFLISPHILEKIIDAADIKENETILEIGPGLGTLTQALAKQAKKVVAIEKDKKMPEILKETLAECKNVEIIEGDILKFSILNFKLPTGYKLVANLPYNIASAVIRKFLETENPPSQMILMLQKEVAQRICATPFRSSAKRSEGGRTRMSILSVAVQFYAKPAIMSYVSKNSFWPQPKVDSAIVKIVPHQSKINSPHPPLKIRGGNKRLEKIFFSIVHAGFSSPRKQLISNLSKKLGIDRQIVLDSLQTAKINPAQRAETLLVADWEKLTIILLPILSKNLER